MIKFVCSSCSERLSVPDQHAGRKGVCPNCHAINRIPLKGMSETQTAKPVAAKSPAEAVAHARASALQSNLSKAAEPATASAAQPSATQLPSEHLLGNHAPATSVKHALTPAKEPAHAPRAVDAAPFNYVPPEFDEPAEMVELHKERRLPKPVKMTLLILAAVVLVGALYFGLRFALSAALNSMQ